MRDDFNITSMVKESGKRFVRGYEPLLFDTLPEMP